MNVEELNNYSDVNEINESRVDSNKMLSLDQRNREFIKRAKKG